MDNIVIGTDNFTQDQWEEIRQVAQQIYDSGKHGGNQLRCAVDGFILWVAVQEQLQLEEAARQANSASVHH